MVKPYHFESPFPGDHFVTQFIRWASTCTDASWEYHETTALAVLSSAMPDVRARELAAYPGGLSTNIYAAFLGDTTRTRKTTSMSLGKATYGAVDAAGVMPDRMTTEGFIDQLAQRSPGTSFWTIDEFSKWLVELHKRDHLQGLQGLLLSTYLGNDYTYSRSRKKGVPDDVVVTQPHLNIIGGTTPDVLQELTARDIQSGLFPRFAIIWPDSKPARKPFYELNGVQHQAAQSKLIQWVKTIRPTSVNRLLRFTDEALKVLDEQAERFENDTEHKMTARLPVMALKVAMLSAMGQAYVFAHPDATVTVTKEDARAATTVIERWERYAVKFEQRLGENRLESHVKRVLAQFQKLNGGRPPDKQQTPMKVTRRTVAKALRVTASEMRDIQSILLDRGIVEVEDAPNHRVDSAVYVWNGHGSP